MKYIFFALRPTQWIKNLFIFLPLVFSGKLFESQVYLKILAAFFLFSLAASVAYIFNDICDYEKDKLHPTKRLRPIASGKISIQKAQITAYILGVISVVLSILLNVYFSWIVVTYLLFNLVYTKILKKVVIIDVFCIGGFFLLRILAGIVIAEAKMSHWIIFMTVLLALFMGFNKRRQELRFLEKAATSQHHVLTKYSSYFIDQMITIITSSIVIVYMLYTVDKQIVAKFGTTNLIYSVPFVYYGIFRYLYIIQKQGKDGDPTQILLSDIKMQLNLLLWFIICVAIIYFGL